MTAPRTRPTYLTAGPQGVPGLDHPQGRHRPRGGRRDPHSDFQKGFIKAEIVSCEELMSAGSMLKARELDKVRMEGKDYVMQEGDVEELRFNV